jgi:hypothetical protein
MEEWQLLTAQGDVETLYNLLINNNNVFLKREAL